MKEIEFEYDHYDPTRMLYPPSYEQVIESLGDVKHLTQQGSYEGDYFVVLAKDGKLGWLAFGYGSCSACDALQGCDTKEEVLDLVEGLRSSIVWFDTEEALVDYLKGKYLKAEPQWWHENKGVTEMLALLRPGDEAIEKELERLRNEWP